jgi:hypothetical protein
VFVFACAAVILRLPRRAGRLRRWFTAVLLQRRAIVAAFAQRRNATMFFGSHNFLILMAMFVGTELAAGCPRLVTHILGQVAMAAATAPAPSSRQQWQAAR